MAQPVRDLTGSKKVLDKYVEGRGFSVHGQVATVQATLKNKDRFVFEASEDAKSPFILLAVITERVNERIAEFLQGNLRSAVQKALIKRAKGSDESPLLAAFINLCSSYKKVSAYGESIFAYTETAAVLVDVSTCRTYFISFGEGAIIPVIVSSNGEAQQTQNVKQHYLDQHIIQDATFLPGNRQYHAVVGSSGLWEYLHPAKAGLHAAVYAAAPELSTPSAHHDPASAVIRAALRSITDRCATSPNRRTAVLDSISQLNRLRSGSRSESRKHSILPRMRGDIHPDLTAAVLSFSLTSPGPSSPPFSLLSLMKPKSCSDLPSMRSAGQSPRHRKCFLSRCSHRTVQESQLQATSDNLTSSPTLGAQRVAPLMMKSMEDSSDSVSHHVPSPPVSSGQLFADSTEERSETGPLGDVQRRWQLLQTHAQTLSGERMLRRSLWGSAVSLALSNRTDTSSMGRCGSCDSIQADIPDSEVQGDRSGKEPTCCGSTSQSTPLQNTSSHSVLRSSERARNPPRDTAGD